MTQISLFTNILRSIDLVADSPRKAWWRLTIIEIMGDYFLIKRSGIKSGILDTRIWPMQSYKKALQVFDRKVKIKTNPKRDSKRIYKIADGFVECVPYLTGVL